MIRIIIFELAGRNASNQKIAQRIARKVRGATKKMPW
jgi:hypothetical protein